jgi:antitoxin MazE
MQTKIARWGNSLGIRIPAEVARDLGFQEGQVVELTPRKAGLEITPKGEGRRHTPDGIPIYSLQELLADMDRLGPGAEPPTLDWGPDRGSEIIDDEYSRGEITLDDIKSGRAAPRR